MQERYSTDLEVQLEIDRLCVFKFVAFGPSMQPPILDQNLSSARDERATPLTEITSSSSSSGTPLPQRSLKLDAALVTR